MTKSIKGIQGHPYLLNLDGKPDLAVANSGSGNVSVLLNQPASAPAKATILADPGGEQVASSKDESHSAFGCGSIDIEDGSSGPTDMGGQVLVLAMLALPFIMRRGMRIVVASSEWYSKK